MTQKLDLGRVIQRTFDFYKAQAGVLLPAALIIFVPFAILNGLLLASGGVLASILVALLGVVATYSYQGVVVQAAADIADGRRDFSLGELFSSAAPFIAPLLGAGILAGIAVAIGLILLIAPGLFLLTIWAVLAPVIVLERTGVFPAFGRSQALVKGNGWQVFGVIIAFFLLQLVVSSIVSAIFGGILDSFVGYAIADLIVRVLIAPLSGLAAAVMYLELKGLRGEATPGVSDVSGPAGVDQPTAPQPAAPQPGAGQPATPPPPPPGAGPQGPQSPGGTQPPPPPPGGSPPGA